VLPIADIERHSPPCGFDKGDWPESGCREVRRQPQGVPHGENKKQREGWGTHLRRLGERHPSPTGHQERKHNVSALGGGLGDVFYWQHKETRGKRGPASSLMRKSDPVSTMRKKRWAANWGRRVGKRGRGRDRKRERMVGTLPPGEREVDALNKDDLQSSVLKKMGGARREITKRAKREKGQSVLRSKFPKMVLGQSRHQGRFTLLASGEDKAVTTED